MTLVAHDKIAVSNTDRPDEIFLMFRSLADRSGFRLHSIIGIAVSMPSPFDYDSGISYMEHKYQQLYRVNVRLALSKWLSCEPALIHFLNDATAFLLGELNQGWAVGMKRSVGITLGTGIGSAFAIDGTIITEGAGIPSSGEIWNYPYGSGTVEDAVSTRAIQRFYRQRTGAQADVREIARLSATEPPAREAFHEFGVELGKSLRLTCATFAPDVIVLGGGISRAATLFLPAAQAEISDLAINLCVSDLSDRAPMIGAAVSWMKTHMPERLLQMRFQNVAEGSV
jgi:glucokinase